MLFSDLATGTTGGGWLLFLLQRGVSQLRLQGHRAHLDVRWPDKSASSSAKGTRSTRHSGGVRGRYVCGSGELVRTNFESSTFLGVCLCSEQGLWVWFTPHPPLFSLLPPSSPVGRLLGWLLPRQSDASWGWLVLELAVGSLRWFSWARLFSRSMPKNTLTQVRWNGAIALLYWWSPNHLVWGRVLWPN